MDGSTSKKRAALGGSANVQATTRVNVEQASKRAMRRPTRLSNGVLNFTRNDRGRVGFCDRG